METRVPRTRDYFFIYLFMFVWFFTCLFVQSSYIQIQVCLFFSLRSNRQISELFKLNSGLVDLFVAFAGAHMLTGAVSKLQAADWMVLVWCSSPVRLLHVALRVSYWTVLFRDT